MLNAVLTVRMKEPDSHAAFGLCLSLSFLTMPGWANFTDKAISVLNQYKSGIVFMLWGSKAQAKKQLVNASRHHVLQCAHPSPHSADKGIASDLSSDFIRIFRMQTFLKSQRNTIRARIRPD